MNVIGLIAVALFTVGWAGGVAAWFYAAYHFVVGKFKADEPGHMRKFWKGGAAFIGCWLFGVSNGLIGVWFGGWATMGR